MSSGRENNSFDLVAVATSIARRKRLFLSIVSAFLLAGVILAFVLPKQYAAETRVLPPQQSQPSFAALLGQLGTLGSLAGSNFGVKSQTDLYIGLLQSRTVQESLVTRFNLTKVYDRKTLSDARDDLDSATKIFSGKDGIISITVDQRDPELAMQVANGYVEELYKLNQVLAISEASQRRIFFEKELEDAKDRLADAEVKMKEVQEKTGLIEIDAQARTIIQAALTARAKVAAKEVELSTIRSYATPNNPELLRVERELDTLKKQAAKLEKRETVQQGEGDVAVPTGSVPTAGLEYIRSYREVKYRETVFETLAKQFEIAKLDEARSASIIQVVDKARVPDKKARPKRLAVILAFGLAGLLLGLTTVLLTEYWLLYTAREGNRERLDQIRTLWHSRG